MVGILSQPHNDDYDYIAASYVKWLESAGARSIVIPYEADDDLIDEIFTQINGVFFPGGTTSLPPNAQKIWNLIIERNSNPDEDYLPLWGTCLGFEFIIMLAGGEDALQYGFDAENISLPLIFPTQQDVIQSDNVYSIESNLYPTTSSMRENLSQQNITMNNHINGITPQQFLNNSNLSESFHITSTNLDRKGRPFVSTIESKKYPIYGTQYHPEKNNFEFGLMHSATLNSNYYSDEPYEAINHSEEAVEFSMKLALFFVGQIRKNINGNYHMIKRHPIVYQYPMERGQAFEQIYLIPKASHWKNQNDEYNNSYGFHIYQNILHWLLSFFLLCVILFFVMLRSQNFSLHYSIQKRHYFYIPEEHSASLEMLVE